MPGSVSLMALGLPPGPVAQRSQLAPCPSVPWSGIPQTPSMSTARRSWVAADSRGASESPSLAVATAADHTSATINHVRDMRLLPGKRWRISIYERVYALLNHGNICISAAGTMLTGLALREPPPQEQAPGAPRGARLGGPDFSPPIRLFAEHAWRRCPERKASCRRRSDRSAWSRESGGCCGGRDEDSRVSHRPACRFENPPAPRPAPSTPAPLARARAAPRRLPAGSDVGVRCAEAEPVPEFVFDQSLPERFED